MGKMTILHTLKLELVTFKTKMGDLKPETYITNSKINGHEKVSSKLSPAIGSIESQKEYDSYEERSQKASHSNQ